MKVEYVDKKNYTDEELVVKIASLSYDKEYNKEPKKLIKFMLEHGHHSVFEFITKKHIFYLEVPIFVARQIMRHRCFSFLEKSLRYSKPLDAKAYRINKISDKTINKFYEQVSEMYNKIEKYNTKEVARQVLPLSTTTKLYMGGDNFCLVNFFVYRLDKHAQKETREIAEKMFDLYKKNEDKETIRRELDYWLDLRTSRKDYLAKVYGVDTKDDELLKLYENVIERL